MTISDAARRKHAGTLTFEDHRCVGTDQYGTGTGATDWAGTAFRVDCDVTGKYNSVAAIPGATLNPVDGIEESGSRTIARIFGVKAFNVMVTRRGEEVHEDGLDRLGLVDDRFGADFETSNRFGVDVVLAH